MQFKDDPKCESRQTHHANIKPMHYVYSRFQIKQIKFFLITKR